MFYKLTSSFSPLTSNETEQAELAKVEFLIMYSLKRKLPCCRSKAGSGSPLTAQVAH